MQRDSLALFISLISLVLSILYFLGFYTFTRSDLFNYNKDNIYFNKNKMLVCDDINDDKTCNSVVHNNNMFYSNNDNLYINKNAFICSNINDKNTCKCLTDDCNFLQDLNHITFIYKPLSFTDSHYGMQYGGNIIPIENKNTFTFSTWININIVNIYKWRSIFTWRKDKNIVNPAILISPYEWNNCSAKVDIRFSNLEEIDDTQLYGAFNIENNEHCVNDIKYYQWFHLAIVGNNTELFYYINGELLKNVILKKPLLLGDEEDKIYVGGSKEYSAEGIILSKTRWFSKPLNEFEINYLYNEGYN